MTKSEACNLVELMRQLWDRWRPADASVLFYVDLFARPWLSIEDARQIIVQHRRTCEWQSPNPSKITQRVNQRHVEQLQEEASRRRERDSVSDDGRNSLRGWRAWYTQTDEGRREWNELKPETRRGLRDTILQIKESHDA